MESRESDVYPRYRVENGRLSAQAEAHETGVFEFRGVKLYAVRRTSGLQNLRTMC